MENIFCRWDALHVDMSIHFDHEESALFIALLCFFSDIYVLAVSYAHNVCQKGYFLAIVSALVETANPELEIKPGLDMLGEVTQKYVYLYSFWLSLNILTILLAS